MKLLREIERSKFDLAVFGLGYESRSIYAFDKYKDLSTTNVVLGYLSNQYEIHYQKNKSHFLKESKVYEASCESVCEKLMDKVSILNDEVDEPHVLLDITVMTRHRLAKVLSFFIANLKKGSKVTICYIASKYVAPPKDMQPVREVGPLIDELSGSLGSLSSSTTAILGLGYEQSKALGIYNFLEPDNAFLFIPKSEQSAFENDVKKNNSALIGSIPSERIYAYDIYSPYDIYLDLKSLTQSVSETSRVVIVPLGPKILSAISLIIGIELQPLISVWRVSSLHSEKPIDRLADREVLQTFII